MSFNPACLINIFLAFLALFLYILGSYRFYKGKPGFLLLLGLAIGIDIVTALLASLKITPTTQIAGVAVVPWYSLLFTVHVVLSMIGFTGFIIVFLYLLIRKKRQYSEKIRKWQFKLLLPIWVTGESIALLNALSKVFFNFILFEIF